mmetsp:Transcript_110378/g.252685  ORF Transcript_110378/g.252685 Transcript_110378/m.252685 type:complete len:160 (+) Transcript_110378:99-578(+)
MRGAILLPLLAAAASLRSWTGKVAHESPAWIDPGADCSAFLCVEFSPQAAKVNQTFDLRVLTPYKVGRPAPVPTDSIMVVPTGDPCVPAYGDLVVQHLNSKLPTASSREGSAWQNLQFWSPGAFDVCYCIVEAGCGPAAVAAYGGDAFVRLPTPLVVTP